MRSNHQVDISIVIPVYFNDNSLKETYETIIEEVFLKNPKLTGEIIFVDDGSEDKSFEKLLEIKNNHRNHVKLKIIKLTRNFGQIFATIAGYQHAVGKCIINLAADLQEPPHIINSMLECYHSEDVDIVIAVRNQRDESFFRKLTSNIFYWTIKKLSFRNMPIKGFDLVLQDQKVKDHILSSNDADPFWQGQLLWTGYKTKFIPYDRKRRIHGKSKWTFSKKLKYLLDGVMGYSFFPIRIITLIGLMISISGFVYAIYIFFLRIFTDDIIYGWAPIMIIVLLLGGFQMLMLGIIGEYLWRILSQVRNRPKFIIEKIIE